MTSDLNINKGGGGPNFVIPAPQTTKTTDASQDLSIIYADGQTQADDFSLLTTGSDKIPIIPTLSSDPRANSTDETKKDANANANTIVQVAPDGSYVTKGSGNTTSSGSVSPQIKSASEVVTAGTQIAQSEVVGKNPSIMEFMKIIQDAIQKLQQQLYASQRGVTSELSQNKIQNAAFVDAFLTASKADPKLGDLVLLRAQLESVRIHQIGTVGSATSINLINSHPDLVETLQKYGIPDPPSGWDNVSIEEMTQLITAVDQNVTTQAQTHGVLGKTLESALSASIFGFMPMMVTSSPLFGLLRTRNALLEAGFTEGADAAKDQAILASNPEIAQELRRWAAYPSGDTPDFKGVLSRLERAAIITAETTDVTSNEMLLMRAPGSYPLEVEEAQKFLDSLGPINDQINNLMTSDVTQGLDDTTMSAAAKNRIKGAVSGLLAQSMLEASVNPEGGNSPVNYLEQAIASLMESGAGSRLSRTFLADPPRAVADAATAKRKPRYQGQKHHGRLPPMEETVLKNIRKAVSIWIELGDAGGSWRYGSNPLSWKFVNETFPETLKNLEKINPEYIPEIFDMLRDRSGLAKEYPEIQKFLDKEPWDIVGQTPLGRNPDDISSADIKRKRHFEGQRHQWPLSQDEQTFVDAMQQYSMLKKYADAFPYGYAHSGSLGGPYGSPTTFIGGGPTPKEYVEKVFPGLIENLLPKIDPTRIPEIYDFLKEFPKLTEQFPLLTQISRSEPWDHFNTQTDDQMIQEAIKMLQKILEKLTSGGANVDLGSLTSSLSETMGLTQVSNQSFLSNQMM